MRLELTTYRLTAGRATDCAIQELDVYKQKEGRARVEPATYRAATDCSTTELTPQFDHAQLCEKKYRGHLSLLFSAIHKSLSGAMDSASDFGSGGWGFESPLGLYFWKLVSAITY